MVRTTATMADRMDLLLHKALLVTEEGPFGITSKEELAKAVQHHFRLKRYVLRVYRYNPEPFIIFFEERETRDRVLTRGRLVDGPYEFRFHAWSLERHGHKNPIPFHVKLSIEGIPQYV